MATKNRPGPARDTVGQQAARLRRDAPGKRFIGERAGQAQEARQAQLQRVERMAEQARRAERAEASIAGILAELAADSLRLARSLVLAPLRILWVVRRSRRAAA